MYIHYWHMNNEKNDIFIYTILSKSELIYNFINTEMYMSWNISITCDICHISYTMLLLYNVLYRRNFSHWDISFF
jgi:hypothetical protein